MCVRVCKTMGLYVCMRTNGSSKTKDDVIDDLTPHGAKHDQTTTNDGDVDDDDDGLFSHHTHIPPNPLTSRPHTTHTHIINNNRRRWAPS